MRSDRINYIIVGSFVIVMLVGIVVSVAMLTGRTGGTDTYYTRYEDVTGLKFGSQVLYMGFPVGQVESISPELENGALVFRLELALTERFRDWKVPADSVAKMKSSGLLAAMAIDIRKGENGAHLEPGDFIRGEPATDIFVAVSDTANALKRLTETRLEPLMANLDRYVESIGELIVSDGGAMIRDLATFSRTLAERGPQLVDEIVSLSASLKQTSDSLAQVLSARNADKLDSVVDNVLKASVSLALLSEEAREDVRMLLGPDSQERINAMVDNFTRASANVATVSETLDERVKEVLTPKTTEKIQGALDNVAHAAGNIADLTSDLHSTREKLDRLLVGLNAISEENRPDLRASVADLRYTLKALSQRVDAITYNLEGASRNLSEFSRTIRKNPSVLLRGTTKNREELIDLQSSAGSALE
ncbi:MAG: MCE family protein [Gammaproteobacteria bacterium]|nr:MCE family protein [Gammaproteobacteria bacterium]NIP87852.1 MCE family protein [Gammaproteobacteria bacterium]NIR22406.1 MCE family protein [Gammaproteobacteria bacterium]NIS03978.1 MCE family protein [Gammaproteobacteria bacterium]NIV45920.1 MCE family protein [Gammaproteobacteria bacterium]